MQFVGAACCPSRRSGGKRIAPEGSSALSSHAAALVSVDWGASSFRACFAAADGSPLDEVAADKGAVGLAAGEHEAFLASRVGAWKIRFPEAPIFMSGMVGSRQGWVEAPYAACPAGVGEIAAATLTIASAKLGPVLLAPGLSVFDARGAPDVMCGEETQILGVLRACGRADGLFVLPGAHCKWARVKAGRIFGFETFMTSEVFAALKDPTVLGRLMGMGQGHDGADGLALGEQAEYLSGLLIGAEILAGVRGAQSALVVGSPTLAARYSQAGALLGVALEPAPANCATLGQIALLERIDGGGA